MNSLFAQPSPQVEILNFQTFTTDYIAKRYGVSEATIRSHKKLHADEIVEGIHFVTEQNKFGVNEIKWTLRGIIKLGMFIRSAESKVFRIWAERELEKIILKQAQEYAQTRARNLELADKVNSLEACAIKDTKDRQNQINGYKSQISQHNALIVKLKTELAIAKSSKPKTNDELEAELRRVKRDYEGLSKDWQGLTEDYLEERGKNKKLEAELKKLTEKTDKKEVRVGAELVKIQNALSAVHQAVGAVASYAAYDDEYFLLNLKG
nr:MAG TPA: putative excisionase [Caudoviricetes sp.]